MPTITLLVSGAGSVQTLAIPASGSTYGLEQFCTHLNVKQPEDGKTLIAKYKDDEGDEISICNADDFCAALDVARTISPCPLAINLSSSCKVLPNPLIPGNHTKEFHMKRIKEMLLTQPSEDFQHPEPATVIVGASGSTGTSGGGLTDEDEDWDVLRGDDVVPGEVLKIGHDGRNGATVTFQVNGVPHTTESTLDPRTLLVDYLRENLGNAHP